MAVLKCKMCGGDLDVNAGVTVVECEYCGTKQTVPSVDDEKKITLFGRANRLRFACEFDKAAGVYESIVADFPEEPEAYWGLVLCKYGIEYVDDPATAKKIPTCHRSSFDSVMDDSNFDLALENADVIARGVYREEAKQIEELRKGIIEVSSKEEPYDIFICYKETADNGDRTVDSVIAQDVYTELVNKGYRVFFSRITLEDKLGQEYEPYIFAALNSAKIMLAFGTNYEYYNAVWVKNEWSRFLQLIASGEKKTLIPCYKDIDAYDMPKEFAKLQAQDMGKVGAIQDLLRGIEKILPKETAKAETVVIQQSASNPTVDSYLERAFMFLEDQKWQDASSYCEKVLDIDPKCAKAYLGKMMAELNVDKIENFQNCNKQLEKNSFYSKVLKYADAELAKTIEEYNRITILEFEYQKANEKMHNFGKNINQIEEAIKIIEGVSGYKDSEQLLKKWKEELATRCSKREKTKKLSKMVLNCITDDMALKSDGTILAWNCDEVKTWYNITKIAVDFDAKLGLKSDGTVVSVAPMSIFDRGQCNVGTWSDIVDICTSGRHTVGLKSDGTVVAVGENDEGQCNVKEWKDIVDIGIEKRNTYGIKKDGTVVIAGSSAKYNVSKGIKNAIAISKPYANCILLNDGTVVTHSGVKIFDNIVAVSAFEGGYVYGLKDDGTLVSKRRNFGDEYYDNYAYRDTVSAFENGLIALFVTKKGKLIIREKYKSSKDPETIEFYDEVVEKIKDWKLFDDYENYEQERKELAPIAEERIKKEIEEQRIAEEKRRQELLQMQQRIANWKAQGLCQHCGGTFKGLFTKKCSSCGKEKDY